METLRTRPTKALIIPPPSAGALIEVAGTSGVGKSKFCLDLCGKIGERSDSALYLDVDTGVTHWMLANSQLHCSHLNPFSFSEHERQPAFYLYQPHSLTEVLGILNIYFRVKTPPTFVVIDSIAALGSSALLAESIETKTTGRQNKMLANLLRRLKTRCAETGITMILTNRMRGKTGKAAGGPSFEHFCDMRVQLVSDEPFVMRATKNRFGATGTFGSYSLGAPET